MSKSKGNFFILPDLLERGADPFDLRLLLLSTHYRKTLNFTLEALDQARAARRRLLDFLYELEHRTFPRGETSAAGSAVLESRRKFIEGLSDDLNISTALTSVFELVRTVNLLVAGDALRDRDAQRIKALLDEFNSVLAVWPPRQEETLPDSLRLKVEAREQARRDGDFALADRLRDELLREGVWLEDTKYGVRWKFRRNVPSS